MGHHHKHSHSTNNGLSLAFWLNLLFSIVEVIGGVLTNSTAIIADAFHDFMDAIAIGGAVWLEKISGRKRSSEFSYGYKRFSLLAALGMSTFLIIGAAFMTISAIKSFVNPEEVNSVGMLWLAVLGVGINGLALLRIRKGREKGHSHSHNHNTTAISLHLLEDVLGWVAVLVGASVIYFTGWYWIDGLLALMIAIFIGYNASKNLINTLKVLLQSVPENVNIKELTNDLMSVKGVENIHDLHVWSLDGTYNVGSLHVIVNAFDKDWENDTFTAVLQLAEKYNIQHPTIQFETTIKNCRLQGC